MLQRYLDDYYNEQFHFCTPPGGPKSQAESLGSILFGDRIFNSPYNVSPLSVRRTLDKCCIGHLD